MLFAKYIGPYVKVTKILDGVLSKSTVFNDPETIWGTNGIYFGRESFSSPENQAVVLKLVENSKVLLPKSTAALLRGKGIASTAVSLC